MSDVHAASSLLTEVAPIIDLEALVQHDDEEGTSWDLVFDDDLIVEAYYHEDTGRLVFTAEAGVPAESDAPRMHKMLLEYNLLWQETSGVRMALQPPEGIVVMMYDVTIAGLDGVVLRNILENFANAARAWKALVTTAAEHGNNSDVTQGEDEADSFTTGPMIRV